MEPVIRELARSSRKESLSAAMTVYRVQKAKSVTGQVLALLLVQLGNLFTKVSSRLKTGEAYNFMYGLFHKGSVARSAISEAV